MQNTRARRDGRSRFRRAKAWFQLGGLMNGLSLGGLIDAIVLGGLMNDLSLSLGGLLRVGEELQEIGSAVTAVSLGLHRASGHVAVGPLYARGREEWRRCRGLRDGVGGSAKCCSS